MELNGKTLEQCVHHYFHQSVKFDAVVRLEVSCNNIAWRAGAIILQRLPSNISMFPKEGINKVWRKNKNIIKNLDASGLLRYEDSPFELFNREAVRVYGSKTLCAKCCCSSERVNLVLAALSNKEIEDLQVNGKIVCKCEFCNLQTIISEEDLALLRNSKTDSVGQLCSH